LPDREDVQNPTPPSSSGTIHVAVETPAPDLRNVVDATYFSSAMLMWLMVGTAPPGSADQTETISACRRGRRPGRVL